MNRRVGLATLLVLLLSAPLAAADQKDPPEYAAAIMMGEKVGYMLTQREVKGNEVIHDIMMTLTVGRGPVSITVIQKNRHVETLDGKPLRFESTQDMSGMVSTTQGTVKDGQMTVTKVIGGQTTTSTQPWPKDALMSEGVRLLTRKQGLKPGTKYEYSQFSDETLEGLRSELTVGERETIKVLGRDVEAARLEGVIHMPHGEVPASMHVDAEFNTLRAEMDLGMMKVELLKCDEAFAKSPVKSTKDFLDAFMLASPKPIPAKARKAVFTLKRRQADKPFTLVETDSQKVKQNDDGTTTVTVELLNLPKGEKMPYRGDNAAALEALKSSTFVQSQDEKIVAKAREIVGSTTDAAEAADKLAEWVRRSMKADAATSLSVGYGSASEVLRTLKGDCTEHSVLLAALCRAVGIPARTAMGEIYADEFLGRKQILGGHQWTQVYLGGKWIDLDATLPAPHRTVGRITSNTGLGSESEWFQLFKSFGLFDIADVAVTE